MNRVLGGVLSLSIVMGGAVVVPALVSTSGAANGTGVYGAWALDAADQAKGVVTFTGTLFPEAEVSSAGQRLSVSTSQVLGTTTPFGAAYGASNGRNYLSVGLASGVNRANVTLTFDEPPVPGTYGIAMGDVDAENIVLSATAPDGTPVDVREWNGTDFNYAGESDLPRWDAATGTITGNGVDTKGASMWILPSQVVKTITLTQTRTSGFPAYQLWIAADVLTAGPVASPAATPTAAPSAPAGKVTICHRTASERNPYVSMTVDQAAVTRRGHDTHDGGIFPTRPWGDIIPPFPGFAGKNWPQGASILANGCDTGAEQLVADALVEPSPSESPSPSGSASPSATPSASPSPSATLSPSPSASGSPDASVSPSSSASGSDAAGDSASPSPVPTPDRTREPKAAVVVDPSGPTPIKVPGEPLAVQGDPAGTVEISGGEVTYTAEPGLEGRDRFTVIVRDRAGAIVAVPMAVRIGKAAKPCVTLPKNLAMGVNRLPSSSSGACQPVRVVVTCSPLMRSTPSGDVAGCYASSSAGRSVAVVVRSSNPVRVRVHLTAQQVGDRPAVRVEQVYRVRR